MLPMPMHSKEPDRQYELDYGLATRDGTPLKFVYSVNVEVANRGFMVDDLSAYVDDTKVGYIRIENVPSASLVDFQPTVFNYLSQIGGQNLLPWGSYHEHPQNLDREGLNRFAKNIAYYLRPANAVPTFDEYGSLEAWLRAEVYSSAWYKRGVKAFSEFKARHVDRPIVSYVNTTENLLRGLVGNHNGKGIGLALYQAAAMELERSGLQLHKCETISDRAKFLWSRFEDAGWTYVEGGRIKLNGGKIAASLGVTLQVSEPEPSFSI